MKSSSSTLVRRLCATTVVAVVFGSVAITDSSRASGGATDPIPGTSKSGIKSGGSGGGGGKIFAPTAATAPAPATQPIITAPLTFTASANVNGVVPYATGSYRIDPYYPTLSLVTVQVQTGSMNLPDGTLLHITVNGTGGTLYPFTANTITIISQAGVGSVSEYVTPGTTIQSVLITDASGTVILAGN